MHVLRLLLATAALAERVQEGTPPSVPGLAPAAAFQTAAAPGLRTPGLRRSARRPPLAVGGAAAAAPTALRALRGVPRRHGDVAMFGGQGGGFLGVGTPELFVVAAVAYAVLGPKELFKLSRQAGAFLGEWQQLGQQARDQFQSALETEIAEDDATAGPGKANGVTNAMDSITGELRDAVSQFQTPPASSPVGTRGSTAAAAPEPSEWQPPGMASDPAEGEPLGMGPPRAESEGPAPTAPQLSAEDQEALRQEMVKEFGDPAANAENFAEQLSGARNAAVLSEYPADLEAPAPGPAAPDILLEQDSPEGYEQAIAEAENRLANLRAEKELLALKRKQMETAAAREKRDAEAPEAQTQWYE